ncbi:MAG: type II secretion system protein [Bacillota bacterium]
MSQPIKNNRGFTLVELLVVIAIIGVLAAAVAPNAYKAVEKSKVSAVLADLKALQSATIKMYADTGMVPTVNNPSTGYLTAAYITGSGSGYTKPSGWDGPYLERWKDENPFGGRYRYGYNNATNWGFSTPGYKCYLVADDVTESAAEQLSNVLNGSITKDSQGNIIGPNFAWLKTMPDNSGRPSARLLIYQVTTQ